MRLLVSQSTAPFVVISSTVVERPRWRMQVGLFQCARKVPICRRHAGGMIAERSASMMRLTSTPMGEPSRAACATWSLSFSAPTKAASSCPSGRRRRPAKNWRPSSHWWKNLFLLRKKSPPASWPASIPSVNISSIAFHVVVLILGLEIRRAAAARLKTEAATERASTQRPVHAHQSNRRPAHCKPLSDAFESELDPSRWIFARNT